MDWLDEYMQEDVQKQDIRVDGTLKGPGFLGTLKGPEGTVSTELSIGVNIDGKDIEIPTLVPTLTEDEKNHMLSGKKPTKEIVDKAVVHAKQRKVEGKSPFMGDWLDEFMETPEAVVEPTDKKPFGQWAVEKGIGTAETLAHLGYGALTFFPSIAAGTSAMVQEKGKNLILKGMMLAETDPGVREQMQAEVKTPTQVRQAVDRAASFLPGLIGEPKTETARHGMELADIFLSDVMFYYPKQADEKLSELGYPNLGFLVSSMGEILFAKIYHAGVTEGIKGARKLSSTTSRFKKVVEDAKVAETPEQVKAVSRQVDKILDKLDIKEAEQIVATQQRFRGQEVGSWMEERAKARGEEVKVAKEIREEIKEAGREERRVVGRAEEEVRLRDLEKDRLEAEIKPRHEMTLDEFVEDTRKFSIEQGMKPEEAKTSITKETERDSHKRRLLYALEEGEKIPKEVLLEYADDPMLKEAYVKAEPTKPRAEPVEVPEERIRVEFKGTQKIGDEIIPIMEAKEGTLKGGQVDYDPKLHSITNLAEYEKAVGKKPSVRKLNIVEQYGRDVANEVSYGRTVAEDMGIFAKIREAVEAKKPAGAIMKEIKSGRYYKEDLKDFGYNEKDIRAAVRAIKVEEFGDTKIAGEIARRLEKEVVDVEEAARKTAIREKRPEVEVKVEPIEELPKPPEERVDIAELAKEEIRPEPVRPEAIVDDITAEAMRPKEPLRTPGGKIVKSGALARRLAKSKGLVGEVTKMPEGEGYYLRRTAKQRAVEVELEKKMWENVLAEEVVEVPPEGMFKSLTEILDSERGSIVIEPTAIRRLQKLVKSGRAEMKDVVESMKRKKIPDSQILKVFPSAFKKLPLKGESEWLKKGQDPNDLLPARIIRKGKGKKRPVPRVTRGDAHTVATFAKDLKSPFFHENLRLSTSEGLFTKLGPEMKETFLYPMRVADKSAVNFVTTLVKESNMLKKTFKLGTRQRHAERIGIYEIAQQLDGIERLKAQGIKESQIPKKLTPKEQVVYDRFQSIYKRLYKLLNDAREKAGESKFPSVKNYSAWFHDLTRALEIDRLSPLDSLMRLDNSVKMLKKIPSRIDRLGRTPGMKGHEKFRGGPETPGYLRLNTFDNFNAYARIAGDTIHKGPVTAYLHELLLEKFGMPKNIPNTWRFLTEWLDYQKGRDPIMWVENPTTRRWIKEGSSNIAVSYISYVWSSVLNQVSSIPNTGMMIGYPRLIQGFAKTMLPHQFKRATKVSDVLITRSPEAVLMEAGRPYPLFPGKVGRTVSDVWRKTKTIGTEPLSIVDDIVAHATWLGTEAKAKRIYKSSKTYKEMSEAKRAKALQDFTKHYADDIVVEAQGSAARAERAPIQRTAEGAAATTLQTFVIANFDLLRRHMLGIGHPDLPKRVMVHRMMRYVMGYTAVAYAFDFMGMRSPNPRPVKAAKEALEEAGGVTDLEKYALTAKAVGKELIEFFPIYGGKFKYESEIGGVLVNELVKLAGGDITAIPRLQGLPGFNQMLKSYRAAKKDGTNVDIVFGRYVEEVKKYTRRRKRGG